MFSSDHDFLDRLNQYLHPNIDGLKELGDLVLNPDVRKLYPEFRDAAVLISIIERPQGLTTLLNTRPQHLKSHAGQISFPGGKVETADRDFAHTAAREAFEELGIPENSVEFCGYLDVYVTGSGFRVVPVVAKVAPPEEYILDPGEVEAVFEVPISYLMNPDNHAHGFIPYKGKPRFYYEIPYFDGNTDWDIWGVTAGIIRQQYETLYPEFPAEMPQLATNNKRA